MFGNFAILSHVSLICLYWFLHNFATTTTQALNIINLLGSAQPECGLLALAFWVEFFVWNLFNAVYLFLYGL